MHANMYGRPTLGLGLEQNLFLHQLLPRRWTPVLSRLILHGWRVTTQYGQGSTSERMKASQARPGRGSANRGPVEIVDGVASQIETAVAARSTYASKGGKKSF